MPNPTLPRERADYSAIVDRPPLKLPGGARHRVLDHRQSGSVGHRQADGAPGAARADRAADAARRAELELARIRHARRGVALLRPVRAARTSARRSRSMRASARITRASPQQAKDAGWEFMGHSYEQGPIHKEPDQAAMIARSMGILEKFTGKRPVGWLGPGLTQTYETPELLAAAGVKYIGDWVYDDEPTVIRTEKGPLVTLPYSVELNDIPMMIVQHHESDYLLKRTIDQFDRLYAEGASARRSSRSRSIPTFRASRTASSISNRSTITSRATTACCTGTASRSSTGIGADRAAQKPERAAPPPARIPQGRGRARSGASNSSTSPRGEVDRAQHGRVRGKEHRDRQTPRPAADRTHRLFADRRAQAAEAARRRPHGGVVHRQRRGMGHPVADAAHGADPAGRRRAVARYPELGLARIRQPRRLLAHAQGVRRVQGAGDARDQRLGDRRLSADRRGRERAQMGVHRPRLHPAQHAEGGGRARRHPPHPRGDRAGLAASRRAAGSAPA